MVMRVSENTKYSSIVNNLFKTQDSYADLMKKVSSLKEVNCPSDDPVGMTKILNLRESQASVEQYKHNIESCESWLTITESKLSSVGDLLVNAREVAVRQATGTATAETRSMEAKTVKQLIDEMLTLANAKYNGSYLFSGSTSGTAPFSSTGRDSAEIASAAASGGNAFDGVVTSGGTYTGSENKTYVVKITDWNEGTRTATYDVSADGGESWSTTGSTVVLPDGGSVTTGDLGDGITLTFDDAGTVEPTAGDIFSIDAFTAGYYNGNGEELSVNIGEDTSFTYSISGQSAFTDEGDGDVDIFGVLNSLKEALENNDQEGISHVLGDLKTASDQVSTAISTCGTRTIRLEIATTNLSDMELNLAELISETEAVDISEIITKLSMKEIALQASYGLAAKIGNMTILDWLG